MKIITLSDLDSMRKFLSRHSNEMLDFLLREGWVPGFTHSTSDPYDFMYRLILSDMNGGEM